VIATFITGEMGGNAMAWHMRGGYAVLALILFRVLWGLVGGRHARFANFVRGPAAIKAYIAAMKSGSARRFAGHNPLGALSVLALLAAVFAQALLGLFANDDIATEGPWARFVSNATSALATKLHHINANVVVALVALHVAAIVFYLVAKNDNLVRPMITGDKSGIDGPAAEDGWALRLRAGVLLALVSAGVYCLVTL
jgi:cytochrome b